MLQRVRDRFALLETLRAYAAERLDGSGERDQLRARHARDTADRLAAESARLWTAAEPAAVATLAGLVDDLHAAFGYAAGHDRRLAVRLAGDVHDFAYFRQRLDLLRWGSAVADGLADGPELSRALATAAVAAWMGGRMDEAARLAPLAVRAAGGPDAPAAAQARKVCADLAMFGNRTEEAVGRYRALAASWRAAAQPVPALLFELAAAHSMVNGGRAAQAAAVVEQVAPAAAATGNPTVMCWARHVAGLVAEPADPERALATYAEAVQLGSAVDCRLFVGMAQASAAALSVRLTPETALASLDEALDRWSWPGAEMLQWWLLGSVTVLLADIGADEDAAVLAGAVLAADEHRPLFAADSRRLADTLAAVTTRLGRERTDAALAAGAAMDHPAAVAHARRAVAAGGGPHAG